MSDGLFDLIAGLLEERTPLNRLEARGTVRLALREVGLEPAKLTQQHAIAVVEKCLPQALQSRGVADVREVCAVIVAALRASEAGAGDAVRPETLFERLRAD